MPLPKPKLPAGWRRAKLIALINELYLSFRGCGTCGVVVNALALSTNPQAGPLRYSLAFHLRRSKKPNCEPKLRPPAVSKSLTRSNTPHRRFVAGKDTQVVLLAQAFEELLDLLGRDS